MEHFIEIFFASMLTVTTMIISYMAKLLLDLKAFAIEKIAMLETDIKNTNRILSQIITDLKIVEGQGTTIAVLQSQLRDLRVEVALAFERIHNLELGK